MHLDVADLKGFYYRTNLGRAAQRAVRGRIVEAWPEARGLTVAGYGFAAPLLRPFLGSARRVMALMPAPQGVTRWPHDLSNVSVLVEEARWPIETGHVDRLVIMHGLETSEDPAGVLGEAARVLGPGGRMLVVVSNRAGLWSRRDTTPFGYGRPYSLGQIEGQLRRHGLAPGRHVAALFQPPTHRRFWLRAGPFLERVGRRVSNYYAGGVLIVEAGKHPPAPAGGSREAVRRPIEALAGMPEPARRSPHGLASAMGDRPGVAAPPRPFDVALPTCPSPAHARCAQPPAHPGGMARLAGLLDVVAPAPAGPARSLVEPGGRCYMPPEPAGEDDIG